MSDVNDDGVTLENTSFYLRGDSSGGFSSTVAYCVKDGRIFGAFYGYAGGGEYDGGFFSIDQESWETNVLGYDDVEEDEDSQTFNALMVLCGETSDDEDPSMLSEGGKTLLETGEDTEDGDRVVLINDFDGDLLSEVSEQWNISLRFES